MFNLKTCVNDSLEIIVFSMTQRDMVNISSWISSSYNQTNLCNVTIKDILAIAAAACGRALSGVRRPLDWSA